MEQQNIRIPPHDLEAEQAVLSSMLLDRDAVSEASEILKPEDFYRRDHQSLYDAMMDLFIHNTPVDVVTLKNKLEEKGILEQAGGVEYLSLLVASSYTSAHVRHYAKIVEHKSILRRLIRASTEIADAGYEGREDVEAILEMAERNIFSIAQDRNTSDYVHIHEVLADAVDRIEQIFESKEKITGIPTGFIDFDQKTAGLQPSDLILIAARPSMGKTAFALNIAQYAAVRKGIPTAIFSLEMSREQLVNRMLCSEASLDSQKLRTGTLEQEDWMKIARAIAPLAEAPIYIDDTPGISPMELRAKCRRLKMEKDLQLVVIDYLQLMSGSGRGDSRQQEISEISRSLKAIAREINAPVIALSQLSRAVEARADHRPMLSDLRESGAIEQDADVVTFLYRDEYYNPDTDKRGQAELIIAKQRNGPTGTVDLMWLGQYTRFVNMMRN